MSESEQQQTTDGPQAQPTADAAELSENAHTALQEIFENVRLRRELYISKELNRKLQTRNDELEAELKGQLHEREEMSLFIGRILQEIQVKESKRCLMKQVCSQHENHRFGQTG